MPFCFSMYHSYYLFFRNALILKKSTTCIYSSDKSASGGIIHVTLCIKPVRLYRCPIIIEANTSIQHLLAYVHYCTFNINSIICEAIQSNFHFQLRSKYKVRHMSWHRISFNFLIICFTCNNMYCFAAATYP